MRRFFLRAPMWLATTGLLACAACAPNDDLFGNASSSSAGGGGVGGTNPSSGETTGDGAGTPQGAGGQGAGQGGATTTTGPGVGGGTAACEVPSDCDDPPGECTVAACEGGSCTVGFVAEGTPTVEQDVGDCRTVVCDGNGATEIVDDDQDLVDDGNACTEEACDGGQLVVANADEGAPCGDDGALFCNDAGQCTGCTGAGECPGTDGACRQRTCDAGICGVDFEGDGTPVDDAAGNCRRQQCDGQGNVESVIDDADLPVDGNDCTRDVCSDGIATNPDRDPGFDCAGGVCDGDGACVACVTDADCGTDTACAVYDCTLQNTCDALFGDPGDPAGDPTPNDCRHDECGAQGAIVQGVADPAGTNCGGGNQCDGGGNCVECLDGGDCASGICTPAGTCAECGDDGDCGSGICRCQTCQNDAWIFFSEYIEGDNNNKALEIYNATGEAFDLGLFNCQLERYANGSSTTHTTLPLFATIQPGSTWTVCNPLSTFVLSCDQAANATMDFNGDDTLLLVCEGEVQDAIGRLGEDPGTEWGTGLTSTANNTLRRKAGIFVGDTNATNPFDPATEWDGAAQDDASGLDSHDPCGG